MIDTSRVNVKHSAIVENGDQTPTEAMEEDKQH